ncbi:MAG TPA: extracellular solute-binding protein [Paracoccaceae bacterium]|nr:extracellular solute-binding protein [Paracoccaceae bacterium]
MPTLRPLRPALLAALLALALPAAAEDSELTIFDWSGYEEPAFHPGYVARHGDSPAFAFFADEDEAFEKLRAGFRADLAHPCTQSIVKWREAALLKPIDTSRITAWADILPGIAAMKDFMTTPDGAAWVVPFDWGNTQLTYNPDKIDAAEVASLKAFADPKFEGRISIGDNVDDAYALAALAIGVKDWTKLTDAEFQKASDFLRAVHKNVRLYWTDGTELAQAMSGGEVDLAWAWNETAAVLAAEGTPVAVNRDTEEGITTWVCGYVLLADGPGSEDKAYDYLNAVLDPAIANYMVTEWGYGHANAKGMAAIDPAILAETGYGDVERFVDKTLFQAPVPFELKNRMIAEFEKIKAGY